MIWYRPAITAHQYITCLCNPFQDFVIWSAVSRCIAIANTNNIYFRPMKEEMVFHSARNILVQ